MGKALRVWLLYVAAAASSGFIILFMENPIICALIAFSYVMFCVVAARGDVFHPVVWFSTAMLMYHFSLVVLHAIGYRAMYAGSEVILISWVGLVVSSLVIITFSREGALSGSILKRVAISNTALWFFLLATAILMILLNVYFLIAGFGGKREASLAGFNVWVSFSRWFLLFYVLFLLRRTNGLKNWPKRVVFFGLSLGLLTALNIGERDVFFSIALVTLIIYAERYQPRKVYIAGLIAGLIALVPILGAAKNLFVREEGFVRQDDIVISILDGEFRSAAYNLDTVISRPAEWEFFYGETALWAIGRSLIPAFIYSGQNAVGWYNEKFHPHIVSLGGGYGFSFAAEGYINFGYLGVAAWFAALGMLIVFLYNRRRLSDGWCAAYCVAVPLFIYVLRADLSNFFSPMIKGVIVPLVLARMMPPLSE